MCIRDRSEGNRPNINGEEVSWLKSAQPDNSRESFEKYLRIVYAYASTLSLEKEMTPVEPEELAVGDVFIKGGSPGHVVIVVDMAVNRETGEKRFILLQGNMPSQQAHIIKNTFEMCIRDRSRGTFRSAGGRAVRSRRASGC